MKKTQDSKAPDTKSREGWLHRLRNAAARAISKVDYRVHVAMANLWRDQYNPLRGLTMARAVNLLEDGERGAYADLQWTYRYIEMQDATLGALIECRSSALEEMDWDIRVTDRAKSASEKSLAAAQAARLKAVYEGIGNLQDAIEHMALASFRGFSHLEIIRDGSGAITELAPVEQWFWVRAGLSGEWKYNPQSRLGQTTGEEVPMERFITREVSRPINRVALVAFLRKSLSQKDWDAFVETYGVPAIFILMPPELGEAQRDEFQEVAENIIGDARGVLPGNSDIKTIDNGARGANPFRDHIKYQDEQMVLRGTGGKLTMLTESGSGTLAGEAHMQTFQRLAAAEAKKISQLFRQHIDKAVLEAEFPGQPAYAFFQIAENEETDTGAIVKDTQSLSSAGYQVEETWLEEKTGYKLRKTPDKTQDGKTQDTRPESLIRNREGSAEDNLLAAAAGLIAEARLEDHAELVEGLRAALAMDDAEGLQEALQTWYDSLPESIGKTPAMEAAWEQVLAVATASGFEPEDEIRNAGTSDGARLGWLTRRARGWTPKRVAEEVAKGKAAVEKAVSEQTDVFDAMQHPELGPVDFRWGNPKGGMRHIVEKHGIESARAVPAMLFSGQVERGQKRAWIETPEAYVLLANDFNNQPSNHWVITGYIPKDKEGEAR